MALKKNTPVKETTTTNEAVVEEKVETQQEAVVEPEVVEEPKVEEVSTSTNVVVQDKPATTIKAKSSETSNTGVAAYVKEAADQGFEDMDLGGFGTFPMVVLDTDGKFTCDDEDWGDDSFIGQVNKTKAVYLVKQESVQDSPCAYTYDKINLNSPLDGATTVQELRELWKEEGHTLEVKDYLEVLVEIVQEGHDYEGEYFIVKLPPSSANAFKGKHFIANTKFRTPLGEICIEFGVGKKRTNGSNKYYPWKFGIVKS